MLVKSTLVKRRLERPGEAQISCWVGSVEYQPLVLDPESPRCSIDVPGPIIVFVLRPLGPAIPTLAQDGLAIRIDELIKG